MRLFRLFNNDLAKEAAGWVTDGLVSESQARAICARYGAQYDQSSQRSLGYLVLVGMGYLFIGLALIVLLGANWEQIPRALRMGGLVALTLSTQGAALYQYTRGNFSTAVGLFFLGNLFYGASIILISQIYHLGEHMPDGIYWWALGTLPIGVILTNSLLALQTLLLALIWFGVESALGFYPLSLPLFILAAVYVLYYAPRSVLLFLATVFSVGWWLEYSLAYLWGDSAWYLLGGELAVISCALFILAYGFSLWLGNQPSDKALDYAAVLALWSLRFALVLLLFMSFEEPWQELLDAEWRHWLPASGIAVLLCTLALWLGYLAKQLTVLLPVTGASLLALLAILLARGTEHHVVLQVLDNLVLIGLGIYLVLSGIRQGISHYYFLGTATLGITAFVRYFDLIGDYIGSALLFLLFAVLLLGAARYWKWLKLDKQQEDKQQEEAR